MPRFQPGNRATEKPITSPFGRPDLRARRNALGLSLQAVGTAAGVHWSSVRLVETGGRVGPAVGKVEAAIAHAERTGSLPPPAPATPRPRETRAQYAAAPKPCGVCGGPIPLMRGGAAHTRRQRSTCGNPACVTAARAAAPHPSRPGQGCKPITAPTGRPDLRARRLALGLTIAEVDKLVGVPLARRVETGIGQGKVMAARPESVARLEGLLAAIEAARAVRGPARGRNSPRVTRALSGPRSQPGLRRRRLALGLTLTQLAAAVPINMNRLCQIERGRGDAPRPRTLARIAAALDRLEAAQQHAPGGVPGA